MSESFFSVVDQLADIFWAGRIGFKAIAGLGIAQTYILMNISLCYCRAWNSTNLYSYAYDS